MQETESGRRKRWGALRDTIAMSLYNSPCSTSSRYHHHITAERCHHVRTRSIAAVCCTFSVSIVSTTFVSHRRVYNELTTHDLFPAEHDVIVGGACRFLAFCVRIVGRYAGFVPGRPLIR